MIHDLPDTVLWTKCVVSLLEILDFRVLVKDLEAARFLLEVPHVVAILVDRVQAVSQMKRNRLTTASFAGNFLIMFE